MGNHIDNSLFYPSQFNLDLILLLENLETGN